MAPTSASAIAPKATSPAVLEPSSSPSSGLCSNAADEVGLEETTGDAAWPAIVMVTVGSADVAGAGADASGLASLVTATVGLVAPRVAFGGNCVAGATVAGGAVGCAPPRGAWPQICSNVTSCGAGALFGPPLPHFQPCTSPSFAFSRLNASDEYTQPLPYCRVKNAQYVQSPPWHSQKHEENELESAQPRAPIEHKASPLPPPYASNVSPALVSISAPVMPSPSNAMQ